MPDQATAQAAAPDESSYRLPKTVVPERYELTLAPDLQAFTYTGEERVALTISEPTNEILLNALDLDIHEATLTSASGERLTGTVTMLPEDERARIAPERARPSPAPGPSTCASAASSTTSCTASTAAPSPTPTAPSRSSPPPSSRPPTPAGPSRAGTSRTFKAVFARHPRRRRRADRRLQRRRDRRETPPGDGKQAVHVRRHHDDVDLPGGVHRRAARGHRAGRRATARRCGSCYVAGQAATSPPSRSRSAPSRSTSSPTTTASPTPATSSTWSPSPTSRSAPWRTSAASPSARRLLLVDPARATQRRAAARRRRDRPRARPHVVRRPRDHEVVERHLAERGVRHVHGDAGHRRLPARVGALDRLRPRPRRGVRHRRAAQHPAHRVRGRRRPPTPRACSTSSPTRRARRSCACSSSTSGADAFRDGIRHYLEQHAVRQHRDHRPVGRHRGGHRRAGPPDHGLAGSSRAATRSSSVERTAAAPALTLRQQRFRYLASDDDTSAAGTSRCMLRARRPTASRRARSCWKTSRRPSTSPRRSSGWWRTSAAAASTACATTPDLLQALTAGSRPT